MSRPVGFQRPSPPTITPVSRIAIGTQIAAAFNGPGSGTSPWSDAANALLAFPFVLEATTTIYKGFACTGTSAGSNFEVGILNDAFGKIVSSGTTAAGAVANVAVVADLTDTTLPPGLYYAAMSCDATTTNRWVRFNNTTGNTLWQSFGCWRQAAAGPGSFPSTATPADMTNASFPLFGLITRSVFDV
jgi:hypothetical protein